jgi:hypothetical protein
MSCAIVMSTSQLLQLANKRKVGLLVELDPEGLHTVGMHFLHNDVEVRCQILMKVVGDMVPVTTWLDIDLATFNRLERIEVSLPQ